MLNKQLETKHQFIATILAFAVIPMSGLATDIYLPSMPSMAEDLHLPEARIQLTLTFYLISYGISQFFSGALVDAFGRYKISIMALVLFVVSFWITGHTQNIYVIYLMRIVQGYYLDWSLYLNVHFLWMFTMERKGNITLVL